MTNEDYAAILCEFASGARGTFEASRAIIGPESADGVRRLRHPRRGRMELREAQRAAAVSRDDRSGSGYTTVFGGDRFPYHGRFVPGSANAIGYEDLVVIEDYEFCCAVAEAGRSRRGSRTPSSS